MFTQGIFEKKSEVIDSDSFEILSDLFGGHYLKFRVSVPSEIISVSNGNKISDRIAVFQMKFVDLIASNTAKNWSIRW